MRGVCLALAGFLFAGPVPGQLRWAEGPGGPGKRFGHAMVWDAAGRQVVLFGGTSVPGFVARGGVWTFDLAERRWKRRDVPGERPAPRRGFGCAWDGETRRLFVHGGLGLVEEGGARTERLLDDLWSYDVAGNAWRRLKTSDGPSPRAGHTLTYVPPRGTLVLLGGMLGFREEGGRRVPGELSGELWQLDPEKGRWSRLGRSEKPRHLHAAAYDAKSDSLLFFGGARLRDGRVHAFTFKGRRFVRRAELGVFRTGMASAWNPRARTLYLLSGEGATGLAAESRVFHAGTGRARELSPALPSARNRAAACFAPEPGILFVHGGAADLSFSDGTPDHLLTLERR